ncbi:MAG: alpha/beta fold hydrolase, partial [Cyanobacteria bacterium P01_D01_bin.44]
MTSSLEPSQIETEIQQAFEAFMTPSKNSPSDAERTLLEKAASFSVPLKSTDIRGLSWGAGPTVLLVHGWGGYGLQLGSFVEPLVEAGYQVVTFDAPAHGSTAGAQTNGLEMTRALKTVAQQQAPITSIIAHSLGAASTTLALSEGLQLQKVVYIAAMCWLSNAVVTFARRARLSTDVENGLRRQFEARLGKDIWQRFAIDQNASNLNIPALLFHDQSDRDVAIEESKAIAQAWSGARLIETSGLRHRRILRNE